MPKKNRNNKTEYWEFHITSIHNPATRTPHEKKNKTKLLDTWAHIVVINNCISCITSNFLYFEKFQNQTVNTKTKIGGFQSLRFSCVNMIRDRKRRDYWKILYNLITKSQFRQILLFINYKKIIYQGIRTSVTWNVVRFSTWYEYGYAVHYIAKTRYARVLLYKFL